MRANPIVNPPNIPILLTANPKHDSKISLSTAFRQPVAVVGGPGCSRTSGSLSSKSLRYRVSVGFTYNIVPAILTIYLPKKVKDSATEDDGFLCSIPPPPTWPSFDVINRANKEHLQDMLNINRKNVQHSCIETTSCGRVSGNR